LRACPHRGRSVNHTGPVFSPCTHAWAFYHATRARRGHAAFAYGGGTPAGSLAPTTRVLEKVSLSSVRPPVNRSSAAASICTHRHKLFMFQRKSGENTIYKTKQPITLPLVPLPFSLSSAFTYFFIVPLLAGSQLQVNPSLSTASCLLGVKKRERERALRAHPISHIQLPLPPYLLFCPPLKLNKFACSLSC
jgi:hypothetical protein